MRQNRPWENIAPIDSRMPKMRTAIIGLLGVAVVKFAVTIRQSLHFGGLVWSKLLKFVVLSVKRWHTQVSHTPILLHARVLVNSHRLPVDKIRVVVGFRFLELINYLCVLKITFEWNRRNSTISLKDQDLRNQFVWWAQQVYLRKKENWFFVQIF